MSTLASYLRQRSKEICADNRCTADEHQCESYAYIAADGRLLDICMPDYFQGSSQPYATIPLPWTGRQDELDEEVAADLANQLEDYRHHVAGGHNDVEP